MKERSENAQRWEMWRKVGLPERHRDAKPEQVGRWYDALLKVNKIVKEGGMVALIGGPGTGKTQLATEAARAFVRFMLPAVYWRAQEAFMLFKECYGPQATKTERDVLRSMRKPDLLILDDLHLRAGSENEERLLHLLLDYRYGDGKATILVANNTQAEFRAAIGDPLYTRLIETGGWKVCDWPSFRAAKGGA